MLPFPAAWANVAQTALWRPLMLIPRSYHCLLASIGRRQAIGPFHGARDYAQGRRATVRRPAAGWPPVQIGGDAPAGGRGH